MVRVGGTALSRHCHDCGIKFGNVHHVGCDVESCPKCNGQFIGCGCDAKTYFTSAVYTATQYETGKDVPAPESMEDYFFRKYSENREEGLRIFIEHHLHMRQLPLDDIKQMVKEFDEEGGCSCGVSFDDIWNDSISFVAKSNAALEEYNKQHPSPISNTSIRPTKWSELKIKDKT